MAGEFWAPSSFLTGAEFEGVGDDADPDALLARSNWSKLGAGVVDEYEPLNGLRRLVPFVAAEAFAEPLGWGAGWGAGDAAGLALLPNLSMIFSLGATSLSLSLILVPAGSGTAALASWKICLNVFCGCQQGEQKSTVAIS